ncbi:MAG: ribosome recycling factor [Candidatus Pacebacteria bacterium]|nr:ribosome recycling factor [Candidatus Paceibacterota bacterium]MBP9840607.1 ribosome recycling factor [Candidatus Paceibacterota bacterium]
MAYDFNPLKAKIKETEEWLQRELAGVRTGRASPALLDSIKPEVYGARTPLNQVAAVGIEDARTLRVSPWDKSVTKDIERAIIEADLGVSVASDDSGLRVSFPMLTAERRIMLTKLAGEKHETAKVTLRGHRTDSIKELDEMEKGGGVGKDEVARYKAEVQKLIDAGVEALMLLEKKKEEEIAQ